jgi:large subunit ribosomal protein L19
MSAGEDTTTTPTDSTQAGANTQEPTPSKAGRSPKNLAEAVKSVSSSFVRSDLPDFKTGDSLRVHAKIIEGTKERVQLFEGIVIKRSNGNLPDATFTVRKVSYNIGVERTFPLHSPRIEKIELLTRAKVRRSRLFYLRPLRGKATRMKTLFDAGAKNTQEKTQAA